MPSSVLETLRVIQQSPRYNAWVYSHIEPHLSGRVLDIGSGLGDIAGQYSSPRVTEVIFSDCDPDMLRALEKITPAAKQFSVLSLDIADPQIPRNHCAQSIDTITCINVLEHIKDDVAALKHMKHFLRKEGKIVLFVPAFPVLYGTLDSHVKHFRRYTQNDLCQKLENAGFRVQQAYFMNMLGIVTWFISGRVLQQKNFHLDTCRFLDRIVPLMRTGERWMPPPCGQSLIVVANA